ncbi:MAG: hypothetical protein IPG97_04705 [Microthrixaceae bacterium]|nr:hypothetical protein [Microthrixaceae bacterium]
MGIEPQRTVPGAPDAGLFTNERAEQLRRALRRGHQPGSAGNAVQPDASSLPRPS